MHFSLLCRKNAFPIKHYWIGANYSLEKKKQCLSCGKEHLLCRHHRKSETQLAILGAARQGGGWGGTKQNTCPPALAHHYRGGNAAFPVPAHGKEGFARQNVSLRLHKTAPGSNRQGFRKVIICQDE